MKRLLLIAAGLLLLVACRHNPYDEEEIRTNALGYLQAVGDYHFDEATPYCTRHTQEKTLPTFNYLLEHSDTHYVNSNRPSVFTIRRVRQLDDTTASVHYHKSTPIQETDDSLVLVYEEGRWLADVHLGPIPYINAGKLERKPVSELPRGLVRHDASSLPRGALNPSQPDTEKTPDRQ